MFNENDLIAVNTLRTLSVDQIQKANSGHPGLPMGAAPMAYALWAGHLNIDATHPDWINRDRFVLSAGHGSALLYSLLHVSGFDVTIDDLKDFRQLGSRTPGHPEVHYTEGVEATTGPLGQGIAQAVGMAMAERHLAARYNTDDHQIMDHFTYVLVGDGDLQEGISYESMSYAGRQGLSKLIMLHDSNDVQLDGDLSLAFNEDLQTRVEAQNWHYLRVDDGDTDLNAIHSAIEIAKNQTDKPTFIEIKTTIGYGSENQATAAVHGAPLEEDDWKNVKVTYDWNHEDFEVPAEAQALFDKHIKERGQEAYATWLEDYEAYQKAHPEKAQALKAAFSDDLPEDYAEGLELVGPDHKAEASRNSSHAAINALAENIPYLWGGSADLSGSNKTIIEESENFMPETPAGRNVWYGVREFAMTAMMNGILLHGGSKHYVSTFFVFSDYLKPAVRLAALSRIPGIYVMTHDSVAVGEDGPTHEPIEQLAAFRATPNLNVIRPADRNETFVAWQVAIESKDRPSMLVLSRQDLPVLDQTQELASEGVKKGAYVLSPAQGDKPDGILIATGSEVAVAVEAQAKLKEEGFDVSVVSMPAQNIFDEQDEDYKESVLPSDVKQRMSIEMAATFGWDKYVGSQGLTYGIDSFGASGEGSQVTEHFGFTPDQVVQAFIKKFA